MHTTTFYIQNHDGEDNTDVQQQLADNVNRRLENAMAELQERHRNGTAELDHPDRAPTGPAYQAIRQQQALLKAAQQRANEQDRRAQMQQEAQQEALLRKVADQFQDNDSNDNSDDDYDDLLDDPALDDLRDQRLTQMKQAQERKIADLAKGHGQVRTITQDEFLPECTGSSTFVAVHFFHQEFERCQILDHHFQQIARDYTECKCLRIDAAKAPFFVGKLQIRTLPTLIVFQDGKAVDRLTGFEGLADDPSKPDEWSTCKLAAWMGQTGAIQYTPSAADVQQELERLGLATSSKRSGIRRGKIFHDEEY